MPKIVDVAQRRQQIAAACARVIARGGIADVTTRAIAREAGIAPGMLFHYFRDKDDVLNETLEVLAETFRDHLRERVSAARDSLDRLRIVTKSNLPDSDRRDEFSVWLSMWGYAFSSPALHARQQKLYGGWREVLTALVTDAVADGHIRPDLDPELAALHLSGVTDGLVVQILMEPPSSNLEARARHAVDTLIDSWVLTTSPVPPSRHRQPSSTSFGPGRNP